MSSKFRNVKIFLLCLLACCGSIKAHAFNDEPPCFKELQLSFFNSVLTMQALNLRGVFQSQWEPILTKLQSESLLVPEIIKRRTSNQVNSPLEFPFDAPRAMQLLQEVLLQLFTAVLSESNVTNPRDIQDMFDYIWLHQSDRINACLR